MKTLWTVIALIGFVSISLFGLLSIYHQGGHMAECLASRLNGSNAPCPESDPVGFANFHSDALKRISNLILVDSTATLFLLTLFTFLTFGVFILDLGGPALNLARFSGLGLLAKSYPAQNIKLSWLALHEKRDPASIFYPA